MNAPHVTIWELPALWLAVLADFFGRFPWPGVAAFLAAIYTVVRLVQIYRGRNGDN